MAADYSDARAAPELAPHLLVKPLGERLGETVGEHLEHDRVVVVVARLVSAHALLIAVRAYRERPGPIRHATRLGGDEVGEAQVRPSLRLAVLLAQVVPRDQPLAPLLVSIDLDIVGIDLRGRIERHDAV